MPISALHPALRCVPVTHHQKDFTNLLHKRQTSLLHIHFPDSPTAHSATFFDAIARQQLTYQGSAIAATTGVGALAILATYYKFVYHMAGSADSATFPWADMCGTLALVVGGVVGMEMWARWAHKALWHDFAPGWALHKSHHEPRIGPFEVRASMSYAAFHVL
jgi:hypothetical protein